MSTHEQTLIAYLRLKRKVLKKQVNESNSSYSSGYYSERSFQINLYGDYSCVYKERTFSSISSGGLYSPMERKREIIGTWSVVEGVVNPELILKDENNYIFLRSSLRDGGPGMEYLNDELWQRYDMR